MLLVDVVLHSMVTAKMADNKTADDLEINAKFGNELKLSTSKKKNITVTSNSNWRQLNLWQKLQVKRPR